MFSSRFYLALSLAGLLASAAQAQDGSPIPGGSSARFAQQSVGLQPQIQAPAAPAMTIYTPAPTVAQAPAPGGGAPVPGQVAAAHRGSAYGDLPMNPDDAKARIIELNTLTATARPQELLERVNQLCEWLTDMVEAHNRMAAAFSKSPETRPQYLGEKQAAQRFSQLKHQGQLLKADLLIAMHRFPESLSPLVDIVIAEPTSATGKAAYKRLQQLGFSQEVTDASPPATASAPPKTTATATVSAVRKPPAAAPAARH
ncbi:MAG TPA: hypothetical protein V6C69_17030 [Trichormus sp.]